jgi:acyl-CoA thioesterase FadM
MNLWLRLLWVWIAGRFRPPIDAPFGVSRVTLMVLPNDLDVNFHMNNGRYLTLMDLGRFDLFARGGLLRAISGAGWRPVLTAAKTRFRRQLRLWRVFRIESRIVYWETTTVVMEHRVVARARDGGDIVSAVSLNRGGVYDPKGKRFVPIADLMALMKVKAVSPPASPEVRAFLDAEEALRRAG